MADSNLNLAQPTNFGNLGNLKGNTLTRGIPKAYIPVPKGTIIPAASLASQAAFYAWLQTAATTGLIADSRSNRSFIFNNIDSFKDDTKTMGTVDTGLKQFQGTRYDTKHTFRYLQSYANYIEATSFNNCQNQYDMFILDSNTNLWATPDPAGTGGALALSLAQFIVEDAKAPDDKDPLGVYMISVQFDDRRQLNPASRMFATGLSADALTGLVNAQLSDESATLGTPLSIVTTTDMVITAKAGIQSYDIGSPQAFGSALTAAFFVGKNLSTGAAYTTTIQGQGSIIVGGQTYWYYWLRLSATPASTNIVQVSLAAPSVTNAIIPNFNTVSEQVQVGANGVNCAVKTFA